MQKLGVEPACVVCRQGMTRRVGALCGACAAAIASPEPRAPSVVSSRIGAGEAAAWLIDAWGQLHPIGPRCFVGRDRDGNHVTIADLLVSGRHAELRRIDGAWTIRDQGSANGTRLDDGPRTREATVRHGSRLRFGPVGFFFWAHADPPAGEVPHPEVRTLLPPEAGSFRLLGPGGVRSEIRPARGHPLHLSPGELAYLSPLGERLGHAALPRLQFQLLRKLCETAAAAKEPRHSAVSSQELATSLPFQSPCPEPGHVRQIVSGLRARLEGAGVPGGAGTGREGFIQTVDRLGYRVTWLVEPMREDGP
jgi:hypothetical protein